METWMAGGLGRAMGGWDEMVFRAMVRDDAYIYDVVGLESEGTAADFQTGGNSYLYGTRFMTWLCYQYGPEKLVEWVSSRRKHAALFRIALLAGVRDRDGCGMENVDRGGAEVSRGESRRDPQVSGHQASAADHQSAGIGVARVLRFERRKLSMRPSAIPRTWPASRRFIPTPARSTS